MKTRKELSMIKVGEGGSLVGRESGGVFGRRGGVSGGGERG